MRHDIETEVGRLAVFEEGHGPPALLWPSLFLDHRSLDGLVDELAPLRRCVTVDGPGHGESPGPGRPYDMTACARAAVQVMDTLGIEAVDWIGNAWGGHVGVRVAIDYPKRVRSLVAVGSPMNPLTAGMRLQMRLLLLVLRVSAGAAAEILAGAMLSPPAAPDVRDQVRRSVRDAPALAEAIRCVSIHRGDLVAELPRVGCPTLWVAGADDKMYPPAEAAAQAARIPGAQYRTLAASAHLGPLERPHEVAELVRAHLAAN